jgi:hypothetical protein
MRIYYLLPTSSGDPILLKAQQSTDAMEMKVKNFNEALI